MELVADLFSEGAISLPLIPPDFLAALLAEARAATFADLPEEYGDFHTRQEMAAWHVTSQDSLIWCLAEQLQEHVARIVPPRLFAGKLAFNEVVVLRYPPGSIGIAAHRDEKHYVNLICSCNLTGGGKFFTCSDRDGNDPVEHRAQAGDVVLLRGHGFAGERKRPFHYVSSLQCERYTCIIRQNSQI